MKWLRRFFAVAFCAAAAFWMHGNGLDNFVQLSGVFRVTPHEMYAARLHVTSPINAQRWLDSANNAIERPQTVKLPSRLDLAFDGESLAGGYAAPLRRGQRYVVSAATDHPCQLFIDVFRKVDD